MFQTLMLSALIAVGQQPPPAKPKTPSPLETAVTRALQSHPDIRVAEAEVQVAQAKLAQAKLKIAQQVTALHADMDRLKVAVDSAAQTMAMTERLAEKGNVATSELMAARANYAAARATLAKAEAEYNALVGPVTADAVAARANQLLVDWEKAAFSADGQFLAVQQPDGSVRMHPTGRVSAATPPPVVPGSPADKLKAVLDKPVRFVPPQKAKLPAVLDEFKKQVGIDVPFRYTLHHVESQELMTLKEETLTVGAWFQLFGDDLPRVRFAVREYGLLVTDANSLPAGAVSVADLWRQAKQEQAEKAKKK
jgi:hypothetical protein